MLGLLGCGFLIAGIICGAVVGATSMGVQIQGAIDQKKAAQDNLELQQQQAQKAENKEDKFNEYQERVASKETLTATMKANAMIGRIEKQTDDARNGTLSNRRKARKEGHGLGHRRVHTPRPSYANHGKPAQA